MNTDYYIEFKGDNPPAGATQKNTEYEAPETATVWWPNYAEFTPGVKYRIVKVRMTLQNAEASQRRESDS